MTSSLAKIQQDLKSAILNGDKSFTMHVAKPARGSKAKAFGIYQDAYTMRLTDFLANDHEMLHAYIGDSQFKNLAQKYIATNPSQQPNARWYSIHLAEFLRDYQPLARHPEIQELAALELALNSAFDALEAKSLSLQELTALDPEIFSAMTLHMHPSSHRLTFTQNTTSIWSALKCQTQPPKPHRLDAPQHILVWRQGVASRFRLLGDEEAMAYDACKTGASFSTMCEMIAFMESPETAAARAASYLRGWIEAEVVLAAPPFALRPEK